MATTEPGRLGGRTRLLGWSSLGAAQLAAPRRLTRAPEGHRVFRDKQDECNKIVLSP